MVFDWSHFIRSCDDFTTIAFAFRLIRTIRSHLSLGLVGLYNSVWLQKYIGVELCCQELWRTLRVLSNSKCSMYQKFFPPHPFFEIPNSIFCMERRVGYDRFFGSEFLLDLLWYRCCTPPVLYFPFTSLAGDGMVLRSTCTIQSRGKVISTSHSPCKNIFFPKSIHFVLSN